MEVLVEREGAVGVEVVSGYLLPWRMALGSGAEAGMV